MTTHQTGGAQNLQAEPWPGREHPPWWDDAANEENLPLKEEYIKHRPIILKPHKEDGSVDKIYNYPIDHTRNLVQQILDSVENIYQRALETHSEVFRINFSLGLMLKHVQTGEYRYFKPYPGGEQVLRKPYPITNRRSVRVLSAKITELDLNTIVLRQRPNTKWKALFVTNILFKVALLDFPIGMGETELPPHIKHAKSMISLDTNGNNGVKYKDKLCLFRAYALHTGATLSGLETPTERHLNKWLDFKQLEIEHKGKFRGVKLTELPDFEKCFKVNVNVFSLDEDDIATPVYRSKNNYMSNGKKNNLYLNFYRGHVSYIMNINMYSKKYQCRACLKLFKRKIQCTVHESSCSKATYAQFPGGFFKQPRTILEELSQHKILLENPEDAYYPYFITFDMESMLKPTNEVSGAPLQWIAEHVPISISIASNVPKFTEPKCIIKTDLEELLREAIDYMKIIAHEAKALTETKLESIITKFTNLKAYWTALYEKRSRESDSTPASINTKNQRSQDATDESVSDSERERERWEEGESNSGGDSGEAVEVEGEEPPTAEFLAALSKENVWFSFLENLTGEVGWELNYNNWSGSSSKSPSSTNSSSDYSHPNGNSSDNEPHASEITAASEGELSDITSQESHQSLEGSVNSNSEPEDSSETTPTKGKARENFLLEESPHIIISMVNRLKNLGDQLDKYCSEIPILGFNSAKYDLNLIHTKLAAMLDICDNDKGFVVKRNNAYISISNGNFKFLDITQYLPPGTSYAKFLKTFKVNENKGYFFYEWLDSEEKLEYTHLPPIEAFYSSLKRCNILELERTIFDRLCREGLSEEQALQKMGLEEIPKTKEENYEFCKQVWEENQMETVRDWLELYNNGDVRGFVVAVQKLQEFYFMKEIDVFKDSISVPGVARKMIFRAGKSAGVTFSLFNKKNEDLYYKLKNNIVGGPSIIFNRRQIAGETFIRNNPEKLCQKILGFDANALYLYCIGQDMPVGPYIRRFENTNFKPERSLSYNKMFDWMDWLNETENHEIQHKLNSGVERRVGPFFADGYDPNTNTIFEFDGCYYHGHQCWLTERVTSEKWIQIQPALKKQTEKRRTFLKNEGYNIISIWECEYDALVRSNSDLKAFSCQRLPDFFRENRHEVCHQKILDSVRNGTLYGMLEVDIEVPEVWDMEFKDKMTMPPKEYFQEMSPIFCTTEIPFDKIGDHMQQYVKENGFSEKPRKLLVGGLRAKEILLSTDLVKWYLDHGLKVTRIYEVIEYCKKKCFAQFTKDVTEARRLGDIDPTQQVMAETMKLIGNSGYGSMIMDKENHVAVSYSKDKYKTQILVNNQRFRKVNELDIEKLFELEMAKKRITQNLPTQIGFMILQLAKVRMLEFYYDFMDVYCDRASFEYVEMDTDSAYMAISKPTLLEIIKPEKREEYLSSIRDFCHVKDISPQTHWFPRICCDKHKRYDTRTAGLFKLEFEGHQIIGLSSKTYATKSNSGQIKVSSKGINKQSLDRPIETFENVLRNRKPISSKNAGFRLRKNKIFTYEQVKFGLSYFYCKRQVLDDGVRTTPLDITLTPSKRVNLKDVDVANNSTEGEVYDKELLGSDSDQNSTDPEVSDEESLGSDLDHNTVEPEMSNEQAQRSDLEEDFCI